VAFKVHAVMKFTGGMLPYTVTDIISLAIVENGYQKRQEKVHSVIFSLVVGKFTIVALKVE